jgi:predicted RNase H-like HicB family nuclease
MEMMKRKCTRGISYSVFYEQAAKGGYVASLPALPGCHTQGETIEEAERNIAEAIGV